MQLPRERAVRRFAALWTFSLAVKVAALALLVAIFFALPGGWR